MTIKIEIEAREWEAITRLIRTENLHPDEDQKFWNGLLDKLIDGKIMEGGTEEVQWGLVSDNDAHPFEGMTVEQVFNFLKMEKENE